MMVDISRLSALDLDEAARFFDEHGYIRLEGLEHGVAPAFRASLASALGISDGELGGLLDPSAAAEIFDRSVRQKLSRIETSPQLAASLLSALSPLLRTLVGPILHVSSTYHGQFKGGAMAEAAKDIAHYHNEGAADYMEVHGAYRLHQDFTGASLPTSPSGLTLWVALNDCPESTLRVFPGSHRLGLFVHKMWKSDDPRLAQMAPEVEIRAKAGTGVLFNALLFHGTGRVGKLRRVSCDLRFFPLSGFLPSEAHLLDADPVKTLHALKARAAGPTILAPVLEQLAFLGERVEIETADPPPLSILNWPRYVSALLNGPADAALPHLTRFINRDLLDESADVLIQKFHNRQIHMDKLQSIRQAVSR